MFQASDNVRLKSGMQIVVKSIEEGMATCSITDEEDGKSLTVVLPVQFLESRESGSGGWLRRKR